MVWRPKRTYPCTKYTCICIFIILLVTHKCLVLISMVLVPQCSSFVPKVNVIHPTPLLRGMAAKMPLFSPPLVLGVVVAATVPVWLPAPVLGTVAAKVPVILPAPVLGAVAAKVPVMLTAPVLGVGLAKVLVLMMSASILVAKIAASLTRNTVMHHFYPLCMHDLQAPVMAFRLHGTHAIVMMCKHIFMLSACLFVDA